MAQISIKILIYSIALGFIAYKILKWLLNYIYRLTVVNKAKGLPVLPFIGNAHQFKRKYGNNMVTQ